MSRGRLPKPDGLKRAQKNPGKRRLPKSQDAAASTDAMPSGLQAPAYLSDAERVIWDSQVRLLEPLKFVRPSDTRALSRFVKFQAMFEEIAPTVTADNITEITVSEKVTMERLSKRFLAMVYLDKQLTAYDSHFGTTPASRQALLARLAQRAPQLPLQAPESPNPAAQPMSPAQTNAPPPAPAKESPIGFGRRLN